jgi:hypothetical protein
MLRHRVWDHVLMCAMCRDFIGGVASEPCCNCSILSSVVHACSISVDHMKVRIRILINPEVTCASLGSTETAVKYEYPPPSSSRLEYSSSAINHQPTSTTSQQLSTNINTPQQIIKMNPNCPSCTEHRGPCVRLLVSIITHHADFLFRSATPSSTIVKVAYSNLDPARYLRQQNS